jgi:HEAT repeat protein
MGFVKVSTTEIVTDNQRQNDRSYLALLESLKSTDEITRRWAARDLSSYQNAAESLLQQLSQESDRAVREAIFVSLTQIGNQGAVNGLITCLRSEVVNLRNDAIEAMKLMPDAVAPMMQGLLHDPDPDIRIFAVNILESLRHPKVESWLIDVITKDPHLNVCATALDLLAEVGSQQSIEPLQQLKQRYSDEPFIQFAIDIALTRIEGA